ncbi:FCD domain-containing protein [Marinibacterium sp. SX1]|uniref:FCD domain-containing protein n=1 Tax=Marinibacterium sp. SX1 TaxID=3388424 RepID=UPI003D164D60
MSQPNDPYASLPSRLSENVKTLSQIAAEAIEGLIANGHLRSGERINESHLAQQLGISRGPIREACRSLEQAGLLESFTNRGMYVRALSAEEARHLYVLRSALAGLSGRLIVEAAPDEELAALAEMVARMDRAVSEDDPETYFQLNLGFHERLVEASRNPALVETYMRIVKQLLLTRRRGLVEAHNIGASNAEHHQIIDALLARDADAAEAAMRKHVDGGFNRLLGAT